MFTDLVLNYKIEVKNIWHTTHPKFLDNEDGQIID